MKPLADRLRKRRLQGFLDDSQAWYRACNTVCRACGDALHDEDICDKDIGVVLDKTDRLLFGLRNNLMGTCRSLKGQHPALVRRIREVSERVFHLRNQTSRFLIRCQGPVSPAIADRSGERRLHYQRALQEHGLPARDLHREIDQELKAVWSELQTVRIEAERRIAAD